MRRALAELRERDRQHRRAVAIWEAIRENLPGPVAPSAGGMTICSVAYRAKACLEENDLLMQRLNPAVSRPEWLLYDNNTDPAEAIDSRDPRFTVVHPPSRDIVMGYEHALGISALLARVRTRFLLIQDPDCFIVMPEWVRRVPQHMVDRGLAFFGTPINPRRHNSYRYFPYMVCMFVDLARVAVRDLCFVPDVWEFWTSVSYRVRNAVATLPKVGYPFRWLLTEQWKTNGWQLKAKFGDSRAVRSECVQPVWDIERSIPAGSLKRVIHRLTPASVAPIPKRPGYCSPVGFASMGAPDVDALGWEEFVWRGRPFAFHVGSVHSPSVAAAYQKPLSAVLRAFRERAASDAAATSASYAR